MKKLLQWIADRLPCRLIKDGDREYLERYYVMTIFGARFYLHRFVGSDPDRGLHDHPWPWAYSLVLSGWYWEERRDGLRKVRWFNKLTGDTFHRVILNDSDSDYRTPSEVWTLFLHRAKNVKKWGFLRTATHGTMTWTKHHYPGGSVENWWLTAPKGRELRSSK